MAKPACRFILVWAQCRNCVSSCQSHLHTYHDPFALVIPTIQFNVNNMVEKELCKTPQKPKKRVKYEQKFNVEYRDEFKCK